MSLIHKRTTGAIIEANRTNSLKSTGPVTDTGKLSVRLNALKHGLTSLRGGVVVPELGEREPDLKTVAAQFVRALGPKDAWEDLLVDQIIENRWRRQRLLRAEGALLTAQSLRFELDYARKLAGEGRSETGQASLVASFGLAAAPDSSAKFKLILECLLAAYATVEREGFGAGGLAQLETVYGRDPGLAGAVLLATYRQHCGEGSAAEQSAIPTQAEPCTEEAAGPPCGPAPQGALAVMPEEAAARQNFLESLQTEILCFEKLLEVHEKANDELAQAHWQAQGILSDADSKRVTRYEASLDRQYERLMNQLIRRREAQRKAQAAEAAAGTSAARSALGVGPLGPSGRRPGRSEYDSPVPGDEMDDDFLEREPQSPGGERRGVRKRGRPRKAGGGPV
jgi:hypothetical protein